MAAPESSPYVNYEPIAANFTGNFTTLSAYLTHKYNIWSVLWIFLCLAVSLLIFWLKTQAFG